MPRFAIALCLLACVAGCAQQPRESDATRTAAGESANRAIDHAERTLQEAGTAGFLWSDSENLLTEAKNASAKGEEARAIELAHGAQRQGELALNQYYLARARDLRDRLKQDASSAAQASAIGKSQQLIGKSEGKAAFAQIAAVATQQGIIVAPFPAPSLPVEVAPRQAHPAPSYPVHHGRPAWTGIPPHPYQP